MMDNLVLCTLLTFMCVCVYMFVYMCVYACTLGVCACMCVLCVYIVCVCVCVQHSEAIYLRPPGGVEQAQQGEEIQPDRNRRNHK